MSETSDSIPKSGFLHLTDLIDLQNQEHVFTTPKGDEDEVTKQMTTQQKSDDDGVAFDLRLGSQYYLSGEDYPDKLNDGDYLNIKPGQLALLTTYEQFSMPLDYVAFISMRFRIKAAGLINVSGFQVDPGYQGVFIFSVYNAGPNTVPLQFREKIFTIIFSQTSKKISHKRNHINEIPVEKWSKLMQRKNISLVGLEDRLSELEKSFQRVKYSIPIIVTSVGIAATILGYLLST